MNLAARLRGSAPPPLPPRKPSYLQQPATIVHRNHPAKYICSCGNNQDANTCTCSNCHNILRNDDSPCSYYGRCVEPLAWNIENELVRNQDQCPLFTTIPKELRDLIFEFALTDDKAHSLESMIKRNNSKLRIKMENQRSTNDIAVNLLRTCRSIYLETWTSPLSLNPYIVYNLEAIVRSGMKLYELLPWQLALIQGLDITLQQTALEGTRLQKYIYRYTTWHPDKRHKGVYVSPRRYKSTRGPRAITEFPESFNFSLLPVEADEPRHILSHLLGKHPHPSEDTYPPWPSDMRVLRARPLIHLTLRLQHEDWWTWTDHPDSTDELHHLGLDPSVGDGSVRHIARPTAPRMRALAKARRAGQYPNIEPRVGWGHTIGMMPDLRRLELVLETFAGKKKQLDDVVEAAKTWKFPLVDTQYELVWDGEVGLGSWSMSGLQKENQGGIWHKNVTEFEVRTIRFVRRRVA